MKGEISLLNFSILIFLLLINSILCNEVSHEITKLDSPPDDINYCGPNQDTIFILTESNVVYLSKDKGKTWSNLTERLKLEAKETKKKEKDEEAEIGTVSQIVPSPVDKSLLIFIGTGSFTWIVEQCGEKITASLLGRPINQWIFHPTERSWALVSANSLCEDYKDDDEPCRKVLELFVTQTLGNDWKLLGEYIHQFNWGIVNQKHIDAKIPKERILMSYEPGSRGNQKIFGDGNKYTYKADLVYSDDFFKTKKVAVRKTSSFLLTQKDLYVSQVVDEENQVVDLLHSPSNLTTYDFQKIETNQNKYIQHSFNFVYNTEDMSFLFIKNFNKKAKMGYVYSSDAEGKRFSLSLKNNIQMTDNVNDFEAVAGVKGVYIANVISGKYIRLAKQELQRTQNAQTMSQNSDKKQIKEVDKKLYYLNYAKTFITFNNGGDWKRMKAPEVDSLGKPYNCGKYCYLHLYSYSSKKPRFYSLDNAIGIVIGNGNVGRYMDYSYQNVSLFLTRDGGNNWYEIKKGTYTYEIGDHGGLIVIAQYEKPTKYISYTFDEGISWDELKISDEDISIKNIINDPSASKQNFIVYGIKKNEDGEPLGLAIYLDFSTLKIRTCSKSDYETWIPRSGTDKDPNRNCIMGKSITYQRRKRESRCVNGPSFVTALKTEICQCTDDDYQCDIGYHRNEPGDQCTPIKSMSQEEMYKPPEICKGYYQISSGYRIIPGNVCSGLKKYKPNRVPCPYNRFFYGLKLIFFAAIIVAVAFGVYFIYNYTNIECRDVLDVFISLMPSIDFSFGNKPKKNYAGLDFDDDDENNNFDLDTNISRNNNKNKKKKKAPKRKTESSTGDVIIETQKDTSNNPSLN